LKKDAVNAALASYVTSLNMAEHVGFDLEFIEAV